MVEIIWTEPAITDLNEIADYIAISNPVAASDLVREVISTVERLEQHPKSGKITLEIPDLDYREVIASPCRIFYRLNKNSVYIMHICRAERDLRKLLIERGALNP